MAVNIDRSNADPFYRYKMPRLVAKVEGSGNGIKTVVANITDIAKALDRPPAYPLKFFGYELGAQTMIDSKNERYIVNGAHDAPRLQELLDGFIRKFVLCPNCNNPETILQVYPKKNLIKQNCAACGHNCMVDMKNKLTSYIVKNPPAEAGAYGETKEKGKGKGKVKKEDEKSKKVSNGKANGNGEKAPTSPTAEAGEEGFDIPPPVEEAEDDDWDDDWGEEDTEEARKLREKELTGGITGLVVNDDLEKTETERLDMFYDFIKKQKGGKEVDDKEVFAEAERLDVQEKAPLILARALLDENMAEQIGRYRKVFLRFTALKPKAQKWMLGGFEQVVGDQHSDILLPKCIKLLKEFYDQDILEEEVLLDWYDKPSKKYVSKAMAESIRKKVEPFIKWLREAESESEESDDDDDDGVPVAPASNKAAGDATNGKSAAGAKAKITNGTGSTTPPSEDEDGEEVDIDAI